MNLEQVIQELRALNEPVPKPLRPPTPEEISDVEKRLGYKFTQTSEPIFGKPATWSTAR